MEITVGKGFYVRSLVRDLGRQLDSAAHVTSLRRTRIGRYTARDATPLAAVDAEALITPAAALSHLATARAGADAVQRIRHGQRFPIGEDIEVDRETAPGEPIRALDEDGRLVAVLELTDEALLKVQRGFSTT